MAIVVVCVIESRGVLGQLGTVARPPSSALAVDCAAAASISCFRSGMVAEMVLDRRLMMK